MSKKLKAHNKQMRRRLAWEIHTNEQRVTEYRRVIERKDRQIARLRKPFRSVFVRAWVWIFGA